VLSRLSVTHQHGPVRSCRETLAVMPAVYRAVLTRPHPVPPIAIPCAVMTSYFHRYMAGEHKSVWAELGDIVEIPSSLVDDAAAVASETMRRVARHVDRIADALDTLGFEPASEYVPVRQPPSDTDRAEVDRLDAEIGGLPAAFAACLREVGGVSFMGDCPVLGLYYNSPDHHSVGLPPGPDYPDPLVIFPVKLLRQGWDEYRADIEGDDDPYDFFATFAPDELHKANISGSTHDVALPSPEVDPYLNGVVGRPKVTLVEYLRLSVSWGGFPGWSFVPEKAPEALGPLRVTPDF
jgi:hypothetical protein